MHALSPRDFPLLSPVARGIIFGTRLNVDWGIYDDTNENRWPCLYSGLGSFGLFGFDRKDSRGAAERIVWCRYSAMQGRL